MMKDTSACKYGLIGFPLGHSFSQKYFRNKFAVDERWAHCDYEMAEVEHLKGLREKIRKRNWRGFNVTIPHKELILSLLDACSDDAREIGAVNTVKVTDDHRWIGYNTDAPGFLKALGGFHPERALILGTGGASKAVRYALAKEGVHCALVSRNAKKGRYTYQTLNAEIVQSHTLIVQCSPLGTYPNIDTCPVIPYHALTRDHLCFDLVYNPSTTAFMKRAMAYGARACNGYEMLVHQAEEAWEIWRS